MTMRKHFYVFAMAALFAAIYSFVLTAAVFAGESQTRGVLFENGTIRLAPSGKTVFSAVFDSADTWETANYEGRLAFDFNQKTDAGDSCLVISRLDVPGTDTAWTVTSHSIRLAAEQTQFVLRFVSGATFPVRAGGVPDSNWYGRILWFNVDGQPTGQTSIDFEPTVGGFCEQITVAAKPAGSASCRIRFGFDVPNINAGESVTLVSVTLEAVDPQTPYSESGAFVSDVCPGGSVSWEAETPNNSTVKFQIAAAPAVDGVPGAFSPFSGPNGSDSYYEEPFETDAPFIRYKAILVPNGADAPTLQSVTVGDKRDSDWTAHRDEALPKIKIISETPTENVRAAVVVEISGNSFVNWAKTTVMLDGADATDRFVREKNRLTLSPDADWEPGLHRLEITAQNINGLMRESTKYFYIGPKPTTPPVTLRDDGVTLIGSEPFFPIGIYGVMKREFNGDNIDEAFRGLKEAGFNFAHSYNMPRSDEFLAAAEKYGFKLWTVAREPDERFLTIERHHPAIIAWYLGDDTSVNTSPEELDDRNDAVRNTDGTRISTQADGVGSERTVSNYFDYVHGTDSFLPEIYPVYDDGPESGKKCVAMTIHDMKKCRSDIAQQNAAPKALWPIIQYFQGWGWKRFPTFDELYAMSFASIIHGANGITWYTYGGTVEPEKKRFNYGVTTTPERWQNISTVATRIRSLAPVLLERTPAEQPTVTIIDGPVTDPLDQLSVSCLMKRYEDALYLLTVNAAPAAVTARFDFSALGEHLPAEGDVLFEDRTVKLDSGEFTEYFAPFAVHIYRLR